MPRSIRASILGLSAVCIVGVPASGKDAVSPDATAAGLVRAALEQEIQGTPQERKRLLQDAISTNSEYGPAHWHSGEYLRDGQWERYDVHDATTNEDVVLYREIREKYPNTFQGQLELSKWCRGHGLRDQERGHLTAAMELSDTPDDPEMRARLGFQRLGGRWVSTEEVNAAKQAAVEYEQALEQWLPAIQRIARDLAKSGANTRETTLKKLKAIDDPAAIPALEAVFSTLNLDTAHVLLDVYDNIQSHQAADALARQALFSPWDTVRKAAARKLLQSHSPDAYAPELLQLLHTTIWSEASLYVDTTGVSMTQVFFQENRFDKKSVTIHSDTGLNWKTVFFTQWAAPAGAANIRSHRRTLENAAVQAKLKAHARSREVDIQNAEINRLNDRITEVLTTATGSDLGDDPRSWWQWWMDYNELYAGEGYDKETDYRCYYEYSEDTRPVIYMPAPESPENRIPTAAPTSCLSAGTTVWTDRGPIAVESVKIGDLALAKSPETGELAYKPVLRTTVRPGARMHTVNANGHSFKATGGHTFWVSGHGWVKIRDVLPGMRFHAVNGIVVLDSLEEAVPEPTYNLVVADFHTYFVGESMILSHDPTFAQPTDNMVPGLKRNSAEP